MKSICKINIVTYFFLLLSFLCGYFKNTLFLFFIVIIHEMGHVIAIKLCRYKIIKVELYPFGGITSIEKPLNSSLKNECFIASSGVLAQSCLFLCFVLLKDYIRGYDLEILWFYNASIFVFNLLPIIPLDGSILLRSFLEMFFPYEVSLKKYQLFSFVFFLLFFLFNLLFFRNYFICVVLFYQAILLKRQEKYFIKRFYLERFLHTFPYQSIHNEKECDYHLLRKNCCHYFFDGERYLTEHEVLQKLFDNTSYI